MNTHFAEQAKKFGDENQDRDLDQYRDLFYSAVTQAQRKPRPKQGGIHAENDPARRRHQAHPVYIDEPVANRNYVADDY